MKPLIAAVTLLYFISWAKYFISGPRDENEEGRSWWWRDLGWAGMLVFINYKCYLAILETKMQGLTPHICLDVGGINLMAMLVGSFSEHYRYYVWILIPLYFTYIGLTYIWSWCGCCKSKA